MSRVAALIACLFTLLLFACKVSQQRVPGTYRLRNQPGTHLVLRKDGSFAFAKIFSRPGKTIFGDSTQENFCSSGTWKYNQHRLILTGDPNSRRYDEARSLETSYSHEATLHLVFGINMAIRCLCAFLAYRTASNFIVTILFHFLPTNSTILILFNFISSVTPRLPGAPIPILQIPVRFMQSYSWKNRGLIFSGTLN